MVSEGGSPFVRISPPWRILIAVYLAIWVFALPLLNEALAPSPTPYARLRLALRLVETALLFAPVVLGGGRFGWLHPLVLPAVFGLAKSLATHPADLLAPLSVGAAPLETELLNPRLFGLSQFQLAAGEVKLTILSILGLSLYYLAFFLLPRPPLPTRLAETFRVPHRVKLQRTVAVVVLGSFFGAFLYLQLQGGVESFLLKSWVGGRTNASPAVRGQIGIVTTLVDFAFVALLVWYAFRRDVIRHYGFVLGLGLSLVLTFVLSGSRSSAVISLGFVMTIFMLHSKRIPSIRLFVVGFLGLLFLARLGEFRRSVTYEGRVDWEALTSFSLDDVKEATEEAESRRSVQGGVPIMIFVPESVGFLRGDSYLNAIFFWLPRLIWEGKPRGIGYYNTRFILKAGDFGTPVPPVAEAYWNFGVLGVAFVFALFGSFHRWLSDFFERYGSSPVTWVPYILSVLFIVPGTSTITQGVRTALAAIAMLFLAGAWGQGFAPTIGSPVSRPGVPAGQAP